MEIQNTFNGAPKSNGPKTTEPATEPNSAGKNNDPKTSGDSQPQTGEDVVNEQEQNITVNGQDGEGAEEFVDSLNQNTKMANDSPLNNENGAAPGSGINPTDEDDDTFGAKQVGDDTKNKTPVM